MDHMRPRTQLTKISPRASRQMALPQPAAPLLEDLNPVDGGASMAQFVRLIRRQRWKLIALVGFAMALAVVVQIVVPKLYEATTLVKVDRHSAGGVVGQEASQVSSVDDMDQVIATEMELALSDPVLRPVAERYHLLDSEKQVKGLTAEQAKLKREAPVVLKRLTIMRPPNSYLLRITYRAHDPQLAANVANAVAQSLAEHANDTGKRSSEEISAAVAEQMAKLHAKMEASDKVLVNFEKELNIVNPEQRVSIQAARLAQLNTELTAVQAERIRRQSILANVTGSTNLASAQAAQAAEQDSAVINETMQRLNAARQQFAAARSYYGEGHPEYVKAQQQVQEVQAQLNDLEAKARDRAGAEYHQALGRESRLQGLVQQTKAEADSLNSRVHQYEQLRSEAENDRKVYQELATRAGIADINDQFQNATVQIAAAARPPEDPIFPRLLINLPLAFVLSSVLGILAVVLFDALDSTFSDPEEIASRLNLDVLSTIPATKSLPGVFASRRPALENGTPGPEAELAMRYTDAIRSLRSALYLLMMDQSIRHVLVTSALPGEGKSTTSAHLAVACAQLGKKVLLVDGDFRRPMLHKRFGTNNIPALSDVLFGLPCSSAIIPLEQPGLFLLPARVTTRRACDLIGGELSAILDKASQEFDLVIVDGSPMLGVPESLDLARVVNSVLLVTKAGVTTNKEVSQTLAILARARANVVGVVMNQVKFSGEKAYGYYAYSSDPEAEEVESKTVSGLGA